MAMQPSIERFFKGRTLVIATKHQKDRVLKPLFEQALGVQVIVPEHFDTDEFGTFSGEINREQAALETARRKCIEAARITGESLVLSSEGSFGGHPVIGFLPADEEILVLRDEKNGLEFKSKVLSTKTNFAGNEYYDWEPLLYFASQAFFPSHALIVRGSKDDRTEMHKGINSWDRLKESFRYFQKRNGKVYVETDMRAMHNPTRMKVILEAGEKLIETMQQLCPLCQGPGFDVAQVVRGLPCSQCDTPTPTAKAWVHVCQHCGHSETRNFPHKKEKEDPMFCDECNP